jgi:cytidylate kinase
MPVVTMTGTIASGAREVGPLVAEILGIDYVDQQIMVSAAQRCGVRLDEVVERDEQRASLGRRLGDALGSILERSAASGADPLMGSSGLEAMLAQTYTDMARDQEPPFSEEAYLDTVSAIIRELAESGSIVILGRGSQMILHNHPRATHVLCIAPPDLRAMRLAERELMGLDEARHRMEKSDKGRMAFYKKFWKVDVEDPRLYDLTIDTSKLSYELAAEVIAVAARGKAAGQEKLA